MDGNKGRSEEQKNKSRALVFRCSDEAYAEIMQYIRDRSDTYIVFSKTSFLRLVVHEEGF